MELRVGDTAMYAIEGANGLWRCVGTVSSLKEPDDVFAVREGAGGMFVGVYRRRVDIEKVIANLCGSEFVSDWDRIICDRCGLGALMVVERADGHVLCRQCAIIVQPLPPPAAASDAPSPSSESSHSSA